VNLRGTTVLFRVDSSLEIGTGHVMRCLTLANALREKGVRCHFFGRTHPGHMLDVVESYGHEVTRRPVLGELPDGREQVSLPHVGPLARGWEIDAGQTASVADAVGADVLVVDHYAIDWRWEARLRRTNRRIFVIDDLADREHDCDILLDQNLGRRESDYSALVPASCRLLVGPRYVLLRPEFAELRSESLARRAHPHLTRILVSLGGVDAPNATSAILIALAKCSLPETVEIEVALGPQSPWIDHVREVARGMPRRANVRVDVRNMARLMTDSDLAIGAAGSTSWERCCLGLPALMVVLADNQLEAAKALERSGAARCLPLGDDLLPVLREILERLVRDEQMLADMSASAQRIVDGNGVQRVISELRA